MYFYENKLSFEITGTNLLFNFINSVCCNNGLLACCSYAYLQTPRFFIGSAKNLIRNISSGRNSQNLKYKFCIHVRDKILIVLNSL